MADPQTKDLRKLVLVPVLALRDFCLSKPNPDETREAISRKTQAELLKYVEDTGQFSQAEIDALYEKFRYGRRISLQLFLTPESHTLPTDANVIFDIFGRELEKRDASEAGLSAEKAVEQTPGIRMLRALDVERFGDLVEFRYKYHMPITYLDDTETVAHVYETRYGFIWISLGQQFVVLLSKDEQINETLIAGLSKALKTSPTQVNLPRDVINEHFEMEKIRRATYRDPELHINRSISGESGMWENVSEELEQHEADSIREGALYDEEINANLKSGIGLTQRKGRFYFTRILSASDLREWAGRRLPNFVKDVRGWSHKNQAFFGVRPRVNASNTENYYREEIVTSLVAMKRDGLQEAAFDTDFMKLVTGVSPMRLGLSLSMGCETCGNAANECPGCRSQKARFAGGEFLCDGCERVLVAGDVLNLMCADGHAQEGVVGAALTLFPKRGLNDQVAKTMDAAGLEWDRNTDTFVLHDQQISFRVKQARSRRGGDNYTFNNSQVGAAGDRARSEKFSQSN